MALVSTLRRDRDPLEGLSVYALPSTWPGSRARVGEREKAFTSLEAAFTERSAGLVFLKGGKGVGPRPGRPPIRRADQKARRDYP